MVMRHVSSQTNEKWNKKDIRARADTICMCWVLANEWSSRNSEKQRKTMKRKEKHQHNYKRWLLFLRTILRYLFLLFAVRLLVLPRDGAACLAIYLFINFLFFRFVFASLLSIFFFFVCSPVSTTHRTNEFVRTRVSRALNVVLLMFSTEMQFFLIIRGAQKKITSTSRK